MHTVVSEPTEISGNLCAASFYCRCGSLHISGGYCELWNENCGILLLPVAGHKFVSKSFVQSSSSRYEEHKTALHVKVPPPKSPKTPTSPTIPVFPNSPTTNGQSSASQPKSPRSPGFQAVPNLNQVQIDLSPYPW